MNGERVTGARELHTGSRIIFGNNHVFRFINPEQARLRKQQQQAQSDSGEPRAADTLAPMDWMSAQRELIEKQNMLELGEGREKQAETQKRLLEMEQRMAREKDEADALLRHQRAEFEARLREVEARGRAQEADVSPTTPAPPPIVYTVDELRLARVVIHRWRRFRWMSLKTELMGAAILLKEANAICVELNKNVRPPAARSERCGPSTRRAPLIPACLPVCFVPGTARVPVHHAHRGTLLAVRRCGDPRGGGAVQPRLRRPRLRLAPVPAQVRPARTGACRARLPEGTAWRPVCRPRMPPAALCVSTFAFSTISVRRLMVVC